MCKLWSCFAGVLSSTVVTEDKMLFTDLDFVPSPWTSNTFKVLTEQSLKLAAWITFGLELVMVLKFMLELDAIGQEQHCSM